MCGLRVVELPVEEVDRLLDLADLVDEAVVDGVPAELDVGAVGAGLEAGLGHLETQMRSMSRLLVLGGKFERKKQNDLG